MTDADAQKLWEAYHGIVNCCSHMDTRGLKCLWLSRDTLVQVMNDLIELPWKR